ncbi:MAG: type III secretion protein [Verrucomicrobia bacterium]|nr:MAG: type III secretion protein [Verrucomicrobiota bacterium]
MFDTSDMYAWMLAALRAGGLLLVLPTFAVRSVPVILRVSFSAILGWIAMGAFDAAAVAPGSGIELILLAAKEMSIGVLMGMAVRIVFATIDYASRILAVEIGINPSPEFDPTNGSGGNPIGTGLYYIGVLLMFGGAHYAFLYAFMRSFALVPPGLAEPGVGFVSIAVTHTARIFQLGLLMAAPIVAVNFLVNLTFSFLGRIVPKMNVFILSFSVRILAGTAMLVLSTGLIVHYIIQQFNEAPEAMLRFIPFVNL